MSKVLITRSKLDGLATSISAKTGETLPMTLDEMKDAVDGMSGSTLITKSITANGTYDAEDDEADGYSSVTVNVPSPAPSLETVTKTYTPTESQQTETITASSGYDGIEEVDVTVDAISSTYVGSGITRRSSSDLTASGATVTVPSGYYSAQASKAVSTGTEGTPTATKGTVSNHAISVTPSVTNSAGYISGGTHTGTGVSVTASELVSGTKSITENGTGIDVTNYASVDVNVPNVDCPVFSGVYDDSVVRMNSCSMTYSECAALAQSGKTYAFLDMTFGAQVQRVPMVCNSIGSALRYDYNGSAGFSFSITYNSDGTITYVEPSATTTLFTVSQSGNNQTDSAGRLIGAVSVPAGTAGTPTANKTIDKSDFAAYVTPSVTNTTGWITGSTKTGTSVVVTARELVSGNSLTADDSGSWDVAEAETLVIPTGTAGTPSATKGAVSNHSVTVTPSVTNTTGWITGSTKSGTAVNVSASELVSGSQTITENGTVDVTNLASVVVDVQGGSSTIHIGTATATPASTGTLAFTGMLGNPTSFYIVSTNGVTSAQSDRVSSIVFDGTASHIQTITDTSNAQVTYVSGSALTREYHDNTLVLFVSGIDFVETNTYRLVYTYGGSSSDIETEDVQVGSGVTSITFQVSGRPVYWSLIFKSNFSTSSGYQRAITVGYDGNDTYGLEMDSSAKYSSAHWTASYSGGNLVISSQGTNAGGYFHQPGYYQLTYAVDENAPSYQSKTVTPTTSQQVVTPDSGYDALSQVTVSAMPTGTAGNPTASKGNVSNHSVTVTPSVTNTTGYITGGTKTGTGVTVSASELVSGSETKTANGTYNVTNLASLVVSIPIVTYYTGSSNPSSSLGANGDIYLKTS